MKKKADLDAIDPYLMIGIEGMLLCEYSEEQILSHFRQILKKDYPPKGRKAVTIPCCRRIFPTSPTASCSVRTIRRCRRLCRRRSRALPSPRLATSPRRNAERLRVGTAHKPSMDGGVGVGPTGMTPKAD